jgi:multisubunit Na+/H+ antiporter MnhG subunit
MFVLLFAHFIVAIAALTFLQTRPRVSAVLGIGVFVATMIATLQWGTTPNGAAVRTEKWEWLGELGLSSVTKIAVVVAFQFITVPIGAHMLSRAITQDGTTETSE